jgi:hypothetical protein
MMKSVGHKIETGLSQNLCTGNEGDNKDFKYDS